MSKNDNNSGYTSEKHKENQGSTDIGTENEDLEIVGINGHDQAEGVEAAVDGPDADEQLEKVKNDLLYLQAEFENYKRKAIKERSDLIKFGSEHLVRDLLGVLDIFNMALNSEVTAENFEQFHQGVIMTSKELENCLERFGVRKLSAQGNAFDPSLHEALSSEESNEVEPGHVLRVFKDAYKMHDRIIRPAQVVVAKAATDNGNDESN